MSSSRIAKAFQNGKAFIAFLTGGDPTLAKSEEFIYEMIAGGADLIEIGVPFSDPIAEGEVIQRANLRALQAGATLPKLFDLVARVRQKSEIPLVFLTYLNPVFRYGYAAFFQKCREVGLDGVIIPDLPAEEQEEACVFARQEGVDVISLIAPTSAARVRKIAESATGFLYVVSSMGVTGVRGEISTNLAPMLQLARSVSGIPVAIGFGIGTPAQAHAMAQLADGAIVGSALVRLVEQHGEAAGAHLRRFVAEMKAAVSGGDESAAQVS
ncbi:MAG: tryptophan synthase subunit alpha [Oscillospiraceae bacterium]|jgi:tryptophan synthase alpha chain|nr:tryptophan synthase subunit alpha [Oscillospiraceae bacterium]